MILIYIIISAIILIAILSLLSHFNINIRKYVQQKYPELIINLLIVIWSVFVGAVLALEFTKQQNEEDDKKNYLSMINSCKNMNERYLKNFTIIFHTLDSGLVNYNEVNRLLKNINEPFLFEEIVINSNLYKCSSIDFRNWLPDIISFMKATNWNLAKDNVELIKYNNKFLLFLKEILTNEENYIANNFSEEHLSILNNESRLRYQISTDDFPVSDIILALQKKELTDSVSSQIEKMLNK